MELTFLTPSGAAVAAAAILPFAALALNEARAQRARRALDVERPSLRRRLPAAAAIALVPALLGLAVAQPVLQSSRTERVRKDAQVFYVFDTSLSMLASTSRQAPTRLDRALRAAPRLHAALRDVPAGVATMTDRVLPNVFPTSSEEVFTAALAETVGVNQPPPKGLAERATTFAALDTFAGTNFFEPGIKRRLVILFTDGETAPYFAGDLREELRRLPRTSLVIIRFWHANERLYLEGGVDPRYRPDASSGDATRELASLAAGRAFDERDIGDAADAARELIGHGPLEQREQGLHVVALSRWLVLAALVPLGFLLWRRNLA